MRFTPIIPNQGLIGHRHRSFPARRKWSKLLLHWVLWIIMQAIILKTVVKPEQSPPCQLQHNNNSSLSSTKNPYAETTDPSLWCKVAQVLFEHTRIQNSPQSRKSTTTVRILAGVFVSSLILCRSLGRTRCQSQVSGALIGKIRISLCTSKRGSRLRLTRNWDFSTQISLVFDKWERRSKQ